MPGIDCINGRTIQCRMRDTSAFDFERLAHISDSSIFSLPINFRRDPPHSLATEYAHAVNFGLKYAAEHAADRRAILGLRYAAMAHAYILGYPRGTQPSHSHDDYRDRILAVAAGRLADLWPAFQTDTAIAATTPSSAPRLPSPYERALSDGQPISATDQDKHIGRMAASANRGNLRKAVAATKTAPIAPDTRATRDRLATLNPTHRLPELPPHLIPERAFTLHRTTFDDYWATIPRDRAAGLSGISLDNLQLIIHNTGGDDVYRLSCSILDGTLHDLAADHLAASATIPLLKNDKGDIRPVCIGDCLLRGSYAAAARQVRPSASRHFTTSLAPHTDRDSCAPALQLAFESSGVELGGHAANQATPGAAPVMGLLPG